MTLIGGTSARFASNLNFASAWQAAAFPCLSGRRAILLLMFHHAEIVTSENLKPRLNGRGFF
jgi:hypothetical protein